MGTLTTTSGTCIPALLTAEKERQQLKETLKRSTVEKRTINGHYREGTGPLGLELQKKALEKAARRKAIMKAAKARGEGTFSQGGVPPFEGNN